MSDFLNTLERQLVDAVDARACHPRIGTRVRRVLGGRRRRAGLALAVALMAVAAALLASTLDRGSRQRSPLINSVRAGLGLPSRGHSRLSRLTVADPGGGPAWSMRIVRTATNLVCLQVGRLQHGRLRPLEGGVIGDGVVHLLPAPGPPPGVIGSGVVELGTPSVGRGELAPPPSGDCHPPGTVFSYPVGIAQAVVSSLPVAAAQARSIAVGLLGPDALSVAYRFDGRLRRQSVEPGTGAYLIVLPGSAAITAVVTYRSGVRVLRLGRQPLRSRAPAPRRSADRTASRRGGRARRARPGSAARGGRSGSSSSR
jgi:hypothetical protein